MFKRFILWDYRRGSWQYDVMVGIIVAFIFMTPREWFRDQPRIPYASMLPIEHGVSAFWIEPELVAGIPEQQRPAHLSQVLRSRYKKQIHIARVEPIYDSENEIKGYWALSKP